MNVLPIVQRELLVQARRPAMHWGRLAVAGFFALMVVQHFLGTWALQGPVQAGRNAFDSSLALGFALACATCLLTADALSGERREGTLGLLLLTPLTVFSVVLGKLAAAGLTVLLALLGLIPALMIPVLAGGVTAGEAVRSGLALVTTALLALAVGLWASAVECERARAVRRSAIMVVILVLAPLPVGWSWRQAGITSFFPGPLEALWAASATAYPLAPSHYWMGLLTQVAGAAVLLGFAQRRLRGQAGDEISPLAPESKRVTVPPPGEGDPLIWRVRRSGALQASLWLATGLMVFGGSSALIQLLLRGLGSGASSLIYFTGQWGGIALAAWAASRFFSEANRSGELELLRTTPLGARGLMAAHRRAFASAMRGPVALLLGGGLLKAAALLSGLVGGWGGVIFFPLLYLVLMPLGLDLLHLLLAVWLGTIFGLKLRRQATAVLLTVALIELLPMLSQMLLSLIFSPFMRMQSTAPSIGLQALWALTYFVTHPLLLVVLAVWARSQLRQMERSSGAFLEPALTFKQWRGRIGAALRRVRHWTPR